MSIRSGVTDGRGTGALSALRQDTAGRWGGPRGHHEELPHLLARPHSKSSPRLTRLTEEPRPKERAFNMGSGERAPVPYPPTHVLPSVWLGQIESFKRKKRKKKEKLHGEKDRKHRPVLGQRKEQHLLFKIYRKS